MGEQRTIGNRWADLVRAGYEGLGRGDIETLASLLHEAAEWRGARTGWRRRRAVCHGCEEIRACLRTLVEKGNLQGSANWQVHDVMQSGSLVAVSFSWRTPAQTTIQHGHVLRLDGDRVVEIQSYLRPKRAFMIVENQGRSSGLAEPGEHMHRF